MKFNKRGGVVGDLITGTGGLIILSVIVLIIVSTLLAANLLGADSTSTITTLNEEAGWINATTYQLGSSNSSLSNYAVTAAIDDTDGLLDAANYSVVAATGIVENATDYEFADVDFNWTATYTYDNVYKSTSDNMGSNLTSGMDNVSSKIPTILLIAAVVLLFGVIVLLVRQSGAMGIGSGGASL